jgi:hypothetical protein
MRGRSTAAPTLSSSRRDSLSTSLWDATSELADRQSCKVVSLAMIEDPPKRGPIGLCIHKMRLTGRVPTPGLPFVIVRGHRLSLPDTSVELDAKLLKFGALFSPHHKMLWFAARFSNNLISGALGSFDRYCRVGLIFAGAAQTMIDCKCFSVAFKLGHFDFRRLLLAFQGDAIADAETRNLQTARRQVG